MRDYLYTRLNVSHQDIKESLLRFFIKHDIKTEIAYSQTFQILFVRASEVPMIPFVFTPQSNELLRALVYEKQTWIFCQTEWCLFTDRDALKVNYVPLKKDYQTQIRTIILPPTKAQKRSQFSGIVFGKPTYAAQGKVLA